MPDILNTEENMRKIREVGETLLGTCKSSDEVVQNVFEDDNLTIADLPIELLHELDSIAMECSTCNWWFEPHELHGANDQICGECDPDSDDDQ